MCVGGWTPNSYGGGGQSLDIISPEPLPFTHVYVEMKGDTRQLPMHNA